MEYVYSLCKRYRGEQIFRKYGNLHILILNMKPIKLQCLSSAELKDASGISQTKTKLG